MHSRLCKRYKGLPNLFHLSHVGGPTCDKCCHLLSPQRLFFKAERGKAFTTFLAGFAFTMTTFPKTSLLPALVAGLTRVLILRRPGMVKTPVLFTSFVAMSARLFRIFPQRLFLSSVSVESTSAMAPFVIAFAFIAFIGAIEVNAENSICRGVVDPC